MADDGRTIRFVNRRVDKLMGDVDHLQSQCDALLDRCRDLRHHTNFAEVVAVAAFCLALGLPWWVAILGPAVVHVWRYIRLQHGERNADQVLDGWRVKDEDFEAYAKTEKEAQEFLAELDRKD